MVWTPGLGGSQAAKDYYAGQLAKQAAQTQQSAYGQPVQDNTQGVYVDQSAPLDIQLDQIVAHKDKGLSTVGIDPHTSWGKHSAKATGVGKYDHIRDKVLKGEKLTEAEKAIAGHYLGYTGGAGTVPTPYSGVMDRFMKASPEHAKAYTDKFGAMGGLNYLMATAPENIAKNTLLGQIIGGTGQTLQNLVSGIISSKPAKELGTMTKDMAQFLNIFGKGNDAKILKINEEAQTPINEAVQEALRIGGEGPHLTEGTITETAGDEKLTETLGESDNIFGDMVYDTALGKMVEGGGKGYQYVPDKDFHEDFYEDEIIVPDKQDQMKKDFIIGTFGETSPHNPEAFEIRINNLSGDRLDEVFEQAKASQFEKRHGKPMGSYMSGADMEKWEQSMGGDRKFDKWGNPIIEPPNEDIISLKETIMNNPVLETGTSPTFDLDTFLNTYSSNPYKDYSGIIRKNLPFSYPWTNVDSSEFLEGGMYHPDTFFQSDEFLNLDEGKQNAIRKILSNQNLFSDSNIVPFAHGGYANMSTYEKMKMIADGVAESK